MDKVRTAIIGGGFTSFILKQITKDTKVFTTDIDKKKYIPRKNISLNKFLNKFNSYGSLLFKLKNIKLHDLPAVGGNSNLWGGYILKEGIPEQIIKILKLNKIVFQKLSFSSTGSNSNKNIYQLRKNNITFNVRKEQYISKHVFINRIKIQANRLFIYSDNDEKIEVSNKLYLACGTIQLLDLLYRSQLIKENSKISMSEYQYRWSLSCTFKKNWFNYKKNSTVIRHNLVVALKHFFGIQKNFKITQLFNFIPVYVDQVFENKDTEITLRYLTKAIHEEAKNTKWGTSIHYCNLKINNIPIRNYLQQVSKKIDGSGMAFVNQKRPGPISNDIIIDIHNIMQNDKI